MQISNQRAISGPAAYSDWRDSSTTWPRATSSPTATSTWQLLAAGEREWRSLAIAFAAYRAMFVVGAYTNHPELNNVGAIFILAALFAAASGRLGVKADAVAIACVAAASASLLAMWLSGQLTHLDAVIKQISLYPVMVLSRLLKLPPAYRSRLRGVFAVQILVVLWRPVVVTGAAISGLIVAALAFQRRISAARNQTDEADWAEEKILGQRLSEGSVRTGCGGHGLFPGRVDTAHPQRSA